MESIKAIEPDSSEAYVAACAAIMVCDNEIDQNELTQSIKEALKSKLAIELVNSLGSDGGALDDLLSGLTAEDYRNVLEGMDSEASVSTGDTDSAEAECELNTLLEEFDVQATLAIIANVKSAWDGAQENDSEFELLNFIADKVGPGLSSFVLGSCLDIAVADGSLQDEEQFVLAHFASRWGLEDELCNLLQAKTGRSWSIMRLAGRQKLIPSEGEVDVREEQPDVSELWQAIMNKDGQKAIELIEEGAPVNDVIDFNSEIRDISPLMIAAEQFDEKLVQALIGAGADINAKACVGYVPLTWSLKGENIDTFRLLLTAGADPDPLESGEGDFSPLSMAANHGLDEAVKELIGLGVDVNWTNNSGGTALKSAAAQGHIGCVRLLLEAGADPAATDSEGYAPIYNAAGAGHIEIVTMLLDAGVDVNTPLVSPAENEGDTAITFACFNGHLKLIKELMRRGASTNDVNNPIMQAILWGHNSSQDPTDIVRYLINNGAKTDLETLLHAELIAPVSTFAVLFDHLRSKVDKFPEGWVEFASESLAEVLSHQEDEERRGEIEIILKAAGPEWVNGEDE